MNIENLYEILDKEARQKVEINKQYISIPGHETVLTLVKLTENTYYCIETKKLCHLYALKKEYADEALIEIYNNKKENNNEIRKTSN